METTYTIFANYEEKLVIGYRREWGDILRGGTEVLILDYPTKEVNGYREALTLPHEITLETWDYGDYA